MTYHEIAVALWEAGDALADLRISALMQSVEDDTGIFPDWDEVPPDWMLAMNGISIRRLEK